MDKDRDIITMEMENGEEMSFEPLGYFEVEANNNQMYIALLEVNTAEEGAVHLYGYVDLGNDEFELKNINSEEEYNNAVAAFEALVGEQ